MHLSQGFELLLVLLLCVLPLCLPGLQLSLVVLLQGEVGSVAGRKRLLELCMVSC